MADLSPKERLQPSLLDRLTDDQPDQTQEPRSRRIFSVSQLRRMVQRDLSWLLNTEQLESSQDLSDYPEVSESVINFGIRALSGINTTDLETVDLERLVRQAVLRFEPRILADTLRINARVLDEEYSRNAISFSIEGQLWAQPTPTQLFLRTDVDLDTGHVAVVER